MYPDETPPASEDATPSGWRAALGIKLAMLGVLVLVVQAQLSLPAAKPASHDGVPAYMLVLSRGI